MKPQIAFVVSILRGLVISEILIMVLPVTCGAKSLCLAMPIIEVLVMIYVIYAMRKCTYLLPVVEGKWKKYIGTFYLFFDKLTLFIIKTANLGNIKVSFR